MNSRMKAEGRRMNSRMKAEGRRMKSGAILWLKSLVE
jgi:hypothetical protein